MEFTVFSVRVKLSFLFAWLLAILLCFNIADEIKFAVFFSLLHEAGHLAAIILTGQRPRQIRFGLFGMTIVRADDTSQNYFKDAITSLAGPLVNALIFVLLLVAYYVSGSKVLIKPMAINLFICIFNLMPVFSLDGGRALESVLLSRLDENKCELILKAVSFFTLILLDFLGIYLLIRSGYNFTLLIICVYLTVLMLFKC